LGPLGGFLALYEHAGERRVLALACDMPFVTRATLAQALACEAPLAAARRDGRWEPFLSVHDPRIMKARAEANAVAGRLSLQALFEGAEELVVDPHELDDWDSPDDRARTMPIRTMS
jgi:molybdopterin-guanine dinucleotide biosynthesis protein A